MATVFPGFSVEMVQFFRKLKRNNRREWFQPRKHLFDQHAKEPMLELVAAINAELIKFAPTADGKPAAIYREADLRWASKDAMEKGVATPGFKAVAGDIPTFATGGFTVLMGMKTN